MTLIIDLNLALALVYALVVIGYWMMQSRVREWAVPVNTLLGFVSVGLAFGWSLLSYGLSVSTLLSSVTMGVLSWMAATWVYDFVHEFVKKKMKWADIWNAFIALFKKKEAKA